MITINPSYGKVVYVLYVTIILFIAFTILIGIVYAAYDQVKEEAPEEGVVVNVIDHFRCGSSDDTDTAKETPNELVVSTSTQRLVAGAQQGEMSSQKEVADRENMPPRIASLQLQMDRIEQLILQGNTIRAPTIDMPLRAPPPLAKSPPFEVRVNVALGSPRSPSEVCIFKL